VEAELRAVRAASQQTPALAADGGKVIEEAQANDYRI